MRRNRLQPLAWMAFWARAMVAAAGFVAVATVLGLPSAPPLGATSTFSQTYGAGQLMAVDPNGGDWTAVPSGSVDSHGGAPQLGSPTKSGIWILHSLVGMAATLSGHGYWLVASDGGVFSYGDAQFFGSTGSNHLNQPIVAMAATPDDWGYWLVASDGGVFSYGDARFFGSTGSIHLNQAIVGMAPTPDGGGYWLVASDGGVFSYGDARFFGSTGSIHLNQPIVAMAPTPDGSGYWLVASDGGVFNFGDATFEGSMGGGSATALGIAVTPFHGYSIVTTDGNEYAFSAPRLATTTMTTGPSEADVVGGPVGDNCAPDPTPTATPDTSLTNLFAGQQGLGWIGGDATYSTALPDGQEAFDFSDTLVGTVQPDGAASLTGMPSNSELVGAIPDLYGDYGGTYGSPAALIPDSGPDSWQVAATYMENGSQLVFVNEFAPVANSPFETFTGRSGIAVLSLSSGEPAYSHLTLLPTDAETQWGNALMQSGAHDYVYGMDQNFATNVFYGMKVARVPLGESLDTGAWTYWDGSQWVAGESNAVPVVTGSVLTGVISLENGSGFMAASIPGGVISDRTVDLSFSCSPSGPWSSPQPVYTIPQIDDYHDEIAYGPTFHPELTGNGLIVSYNIDTTDPLSVLEQEVHAYQPQFLQING
jgi:Domain of unknown function (DUF4185)